MRVLLVESQNLVRRGLRDLLDGNRGIEVVGLAANAHEALECVRTIPTDLAVVGVRLSDSDGVELGRRLRITREGLRILILAPGGDRSAILRAITSGAHGFLQLDVAEELLVSVVRGLGRGHTMFNPQIAEALVRERSPEAQLDRIRFLTAQERLVLELLAQGMPNRDIAERAHLAEKTVRNYVSRVLLKLGVRNRTEAALYAAEHHLVARGA
ncbi:MAG: LuxR C-terminal-related transcriptional regulator [Actinomycetota bacterium]